jgi:hypothetical protein
MVFPTKAHSVVLSYSFTEKVCSVVLMPSNLVDGKHDLEEVFCLNFQLRNIYRYICTSDMLVQIL